MLGWRNWLYAQDLKSCFRLPGSVGSSPTPSTKIPVHAGINRSQSPRILRNVLQKTSPVHRQHPISSERVIVTACSIAFVHFKFVFRVFFAEHPHPSVTQNLCADRSKSNDDFFFIAFDDGL